MKKLLVLFFIMVIFSLCANAKSYKGGINTVISNSGISKSSVSVSVKNLATGKTVYALNENILMHPASVQKILSLPAVMEVLGENYEFTTGLYKRNDNTYVIKLGADPFLDTSDLKTLVKSIDKQTVKKIMIDDSAIEMKDWGEGWQWDDDLNVYILRFNSYNLDGNVMNITLMPQNGKIIIINPSKYPIVFFNNVVIGNSNNITVSRDSSISSNTLTLSGTIARPQTLTVPINNLERYFNIKLTQVLENRNIYLKENYSKTKVLPSDKLICEIKHPIEPAENEILKNSSNVMMETAGKLAAQKQYKTTGSDTNAVKLYYTYLQSLGLDTSRIRLVDSSGVSKNNLVDTDFITKYLLKNKDNTALLKMAKPGEGTLSNRMYPLKDNLTAKTGTLSDISSIAGYLTSRSGVKYAFCIMINDPNSSESDKKALEDYIIREIYLK